MPAIPRQTAVAELKRSNAQGSGYHKVSPRRSAVAELKDMDPTLQTLAELEDANRYAVKRGVPIWVPHRRRVRGPDGSTQEVVVREEDLPEYANRINRLEAERGVLGRITDGHVTASGPPPKLVGYYKNARVGYFGPKRTPAVLVDCYFRRECLSIVAERPYRSPEVYPDVKEIRGLALLLKDPYLDMGTVTYHSVARPICYGGGHMPDLEDVTPAEKELFEKFLRYLRVTFGLSDNWPQEEAAEETEEPTEETEEAAEEEGEEAAEEESDNYEEESEEKKKGEGESVSYERELSQLRASYARLKAELQGIATEREIERCQSLIAQRLVGYQLNDKERNKEVARLVRMTGPEREERLAELQVLYARRKLPAGQLRLYDGHVEPAAAEDPLVKAPWYHEQAIAYMLKHPGVQYDQAVQHVQSLAKRDV